jgi:hypothetical protein
MGRRSLNAYTPLEACPKAAIGKMKTCEGCPFGIRLSALCCIRRRAIPSSPEGAAFARQPHLVVHYICRLTRPSRQVFNLRSHERLRIVIARKLSLLQLEVHLISLPEASCGLVILIPLDCNFVADDLCLFDGFFTSSSLVPPARTRPHQRGLR